MKVIVVGTRGIPNIQGGVETHCEQLYPLLVNKGVDVELIRRKPYVKEKISSYKGVKLKDIYTPKSKSLEAIVHTFLSILYAKKRRANILHIHGIGPGILVPLARLLGLKVVVTHHSLNYLHKKWGRIARLMLKIGEIFTAKYANEVIVISPIFINTLSEYTPKEKINLIFNGVNKPNILNSTDYLDNLDILPRQYIIALGRFVEDKGFHNLIESYSKSNLKDKFKLVLAGDADHESPYSISLKKMAKENNVILTGFIKGKTLEELMSHAALFVLPSFHEGLPISLLEAMSYKLNVLTSDIPANREVTLEESDYFDPHNNEELRIKLETKLLVNTSYKREYNLAKYDWTTISEEVLGVYKKCLN